MGVEIHATPCGTCDHSEGTCNAHHERTWTIRSLRRLQLFTFEFDAQHLWHRRAIAAHSPEDYSVSSVRFAEFDLTKPERLTSTSPLFLSGRNSDPRHPYLPTCFSVHTQSNMTIQHPSMTYLTLPETGLVLWQDGDSPEFR